MPLPPPSKPKRKAPETIAAVTEKFMQEAKRHWPAIVTQMKLTPHSAIDGLEASKARKQGIYHDPAAADAFDEALTKITTDLAIAKVEARKEKRNARA